MHAAKRENFAEFDSGFLGPALDFTGITGAQDHLIWPHTIDDRVVFDVPGIILSR
jgi:hypothetical protein